MSQYYEEQNQTTGFFQWITDGLKAPWNWFFQEKEQPKLVYHPTYSPSKQWPSEPEYRNASMEQQYEPSWSYTPQSMFQQPEPKLQFEEKLKTVVQSEQKQVLKQTTKAILSAATTVLPAEVQKIIPYLEAIPAALKAFNINIPNLKVEIGSADAGTVEADGLVFEMDPSSNRYKQKWGSSWTRTPCGDPVRNRRLFEEVVEAMSQILNISATEFRQNLINEIELSPDISRLFRLAGCQNNLQNSFFGGSGAGSVNSSGNGNGNGNNNSRGNNQDKNQGYGYKKDYNDEEDSEDKKRRKRTESIHDDPTEEIPPLEHLITRFLALFDMAAVNQRIAELLEIPRGDVMQAGRSQYQDRSSPNKELHASHIMRGQITKNVRTKLKHNYKAVYEYLMVKLGYTELAEKWANKWGGIGQDIDLIQVELLNLLEAIDFSQNPPRMVQNFPLERLQEIIENINALLRNIDPSATAIALPSQTLWSRFESLFIDQPTEESITVETIVEMCKDCFKKISNKWINKSNSTSKHVLEQALKILTNEKVSDLLQLGTEAYVRFGQLLLTKSKCGENEFKINDEDEDDDDKGVKYLSNIPDINVKRCTVWGTVKAKAKNDTADKKTSGNSSSDIKDALFMMCIIFLAIAIIVGAFYCCSTVVIVDPVILEKTATVATSTIHKFVKIAVLF